MFEPRHYDCGQQIQIKTPLDFMAVTDHAEYLGFMAAMDEPGHLLSEIALAKDLNSAVSERAISKLKASVLTPAGEEIALPFKFNLSEPD